MINISRPSDKITMLVTFYYVLFRQINKKIFFSLWLALRRISISYQSEWILLLLSHWEGSQYLLYQSEWILLLLSHWEGSQYLLYQSEWILLLLSHWEGSQYLLYQSEWILLLLSHWEGSQYLMYQSEWILLLLSRNLELNISLILIFADF